MFARSIRLAAPLLARSAITPVIVRQVAAPASLLRSALLSPLPVSVRAYSNGYGNDGERPPREVFPPSNRLFVRQLPMGTNNESLVELFKEHGAIDGFVMTQRDGIPKRHGIVKFETTEAATEALNSLASRPTDDGDLPIAGAFALTEEGHNAAVAQRRLAMEPPQPQLFLGNLAEVATEQLEAALDEILADKPYQLNRGYDRETGLLHSFAFAQFNSTAEAQAAKDVLAGFEVAGVRLKVSFPRAKTEGSRNSGGRDGRHGGRGSREGDRRRRDDHNQF